MNHPTELEQFLSEQRDDGHQDSEGVFTLAGRLAVEKLAQFQLPFRSAWVLKLIQCAIREGAVASIQVELTARQAKFSFYTSSFSAHEVEAAFLTPELNSNVSLRHLVGALWSVGIQEKWPFELALCRAPKSLVWDGKNFHQRTVKRKAVKTTLVISLNPEDGGWLGSMMRMADVNAEILQTLKQWCYTCPVPLIVDGRRMDSLQACWGHGWGSESCPLALGFAEAEVPDLQLSPGTFEKQPATDGETAFMTDARKTMARVSPRQVASVPFLLAHHVEAQGTGKNVIWHPHPGESVIYWVADGVVVQTEPLTGSESLLTVGCFVSAEGLKTDLTTLYLREAPEREHRKAMVRQAVVSALRDLTVLDESMEEQATLARSKGSWNQKIFSLAGFGAFWVSPVAGLLLFGAAWFSGKAPDRDIKERDQRYKEEVAELLALL
jgi:hypothetical protein